MEQSLIRLAGRSAFAHAALTILSVITLLLFFTLGGFWGPLNDLLSVFWVLTFVPITLWLYRLHRPVNASLSLATAILGIAAALTFAALQLLLVIGVVRFAQTVATIHTLGGAIGLSLLLPGLLARARRTLPPRIYWATIILGAGFAVAAAGFWTGGMWNPLTSAGFAVAMIAGLVWGIWLGQLLGNGYVLEMVTINTGGSR